MDTKLFARSQPGGLFAVTDREFYPSGTVFWVCSTTGTDGAGFGQNPDAPVATVDYAVGLCTASVGDVIFVMPGHHESLDANTDCLIDVIGVSVIGLGRGMNRPILDFDDTDGTVEMDAANCRISNIILRSSIASTVTGINVDAHDCEIDHCLFTWETTGDEFVDCINLNAFDRTHIHDNVFDTEEAAGAAVSAINIVDANDVTIERNIFRGFWSGGSILGVTTLSARLLILDNVIYNSSTAVYAGLDLGALNGTGLVAGNYITSLYAAPLTKNVRAGGLTWHHNSVANAVSERAAATIPTTSSV
jgi:hypothetical protein